MGQSIGFIGVGRMGARMCRRIVNAGFDVTILDSDKAAMQPLVDAGAKAAANAAEVGSAAEIVIVSLPTPPIVQAVAQEVAKGSKVKIFVDTSTTGATYEKHIAAALAEKGITCVDAPVSGGLKGAENGTLAVMVSCSDDIFAKIEPALKHTGKLFHVGKEPGQGQTMKLVNNMLSATAMAATSEVMVMAVKAGLDPRQALDVINAGTGKNSASDDKFPRFIVNRNFNLGFALGLLNKDLRLCMEEAEALGVPMIVGSAVRQMLAIAVASEGADGDMTDIVKPVERWAGVTVGSK
jgi:2-hydroxy-3-oxopropionate reductase